MIGIKNFEEIVYNFKKDSFSVVVWAIGSLKGIKEIIAFKMLKQLKGDNLFGDLGKEGQVGDRPVVL